MTHLTASTSGAALLGSDRPAARAGSWWGDLVLLTKPRLTLMVVVTAYTGFAVGVNHPATVGVWSWWLLVATLIGVTLSCMAASVFNQIYERDTDALMRRTMNRPLPMGRVGLRQTMGLGLVMGGVGVGLLAVVANPLTAGLGLGTILGYVLIYTPMKRTSSLSTVVGAVPGALPPVMGYTAATGRLGLEAWLLFSILFLWQLPHFLAIAWLYRDQYGRAGMAMLPVIDPSGESTFRQILLGCLALVPLGLVPTMVGMCGMVYFWGALLAGVVFLGFGVALVIGRTRRHARAMFFASLVYLPVVYLLMLVDNAGALS